MSSWETLMISLEGIFGKKPESLESIFFVIGMQELGRIEDSFTKEQKQDILHLGICSVLEKANYYKYTGKDMEGWPHFEVNKALPSMTTQEEETFLKSQVLHYFKEKNIA